MVIRIVNGAENMPAYGGSLSKDELEAIVVFLSSKEKQSN
jgi:ubiquinol-cytochrome c reductase cytochrome b subunit